MLTHRLGSRQDDPPNQLPASLRSWLWDSGWSDLHRDNHTYVDLDMEYQPAARPISEAPPLRNQRIQPYQSLYSSSTHAEALTSRHPIAGWQPAWLTSVPREFEALQPRLHDALIFSNRSDDVQFNNTSRNEDNADSSSKRDKTHDFIYESGTKRSKDLETKKARRRGVFDNESRAKVNKVRSVGACWRCRLLKEKVRYYHE